MSIQSKIDIIQHVLSISLKVLDMLAKIVQIISDKISEGV